MSFVRVAAIAGFLGLFLACDPQPAPADPVDTAPCAAEWTTDHTPVQADEYVWNGQTVYWFDFGCCDMYIEVYDAQCNYLCAPEGGIMAGGDGRCPTFYDEATYVDTVYAQ